MGIEWLELAEKVFFRSGTRYQLTEQGRKIIPAVLKTMNLSIEQLFKVA